MTDPDHPSTTKTVTGCDDCPMMYDHIACQLADDGFDPDGPDAGPMGDGTPPTWCPLRKGPVLVRLEDT